MKTDPAKGQKNRLEKLGDRASFRAQIRAKPQSWHFPTADKIKIAEGWFARVAIA